MGYEEDTCSFTCNTGYELTGSDTRTCQSDGSWSGSETMCVRGALNIGSCILNISCHGYVYSLVSCSSLTNPSNGVINCSLGDDGIFSYEDVCMYSCNNGYELVYETRMCQSNGSWSGTDDVCRKGNVVCK